MLDFLLRLLSGVDFAAGYTTVLRLIFPILTFVILWRCGRSLLLFRKEPEIWGYLVLQNGDQIPITHWENVIGRSKGSDLVVNVATVSRSHAVLTRYDDGSWTIGDVGSKGGIFVNGKETTGLTEVKFGDVLSLGGVDLTLMPLTEDERLDESQYRTKAGSSVKAGLTLLLLTVFQLLAAFQLTLTVKTEYLTNVYTCIAGLAALEWLLFAVMRLMKRTGYEVETIAFYLTTLGFCVIASSAPDELRKQLLTVCIGLFVFLFLGWMLRDLERAKKFRYLMAAAGLALFAVNLLFGTEQYGAKNWIQLGPFSFQPSELVKICFVFVGMSTMDRLMARRNLVLFILYSGIMCGCLALMNDFGSALVFFAAFLVIAFLRSGDFATLSLICAGTAFAASIALRFRPYVLKRFSAWGHVWAYALEGGYQQTRSMMCIAAGGLLGLGAGNGYLKYVAASDTDLVFAFVSEEWGLLVALLMAAAIVILALFTVKSTAVGRSSFYTIGACAAMSMLMVQAILNVFGTVDFLPLTGVTFPFVSNGGSSMISAWGLLAFIKAVDTRQNASFAIRLPSVKKRRDEA